MNNHRPSNIDLGKNQITEKIRVSSAAIYRDELPYDYWLVETWIFSDDNRLDSHQIIHGTPPVFPGGTIPDYVYNKCKRVHGYIVKNLQDRFGGWRAIFYRHMWS